MTDLSKIINGLQPNANYTVQVRSKNSDGQYSDWSNTYSFNTPSATLNTTNSVVVQQLAGGLLFSGDPLLDQGTQPYILISQDGIQGGQGGDLAFALPTGSGQQPTIGAFQIQRTDLVLPSTFTISNIPVVAGRKYFYLPQTYASSVSYGMLVSDNLSRIPANTYVTAVRATSNAASISVAISSSIVTSGNSNITFRAPDAKFRVGTSASNSITIQGPNAGGILDTPASIFTTINGVSTSSNSGAGFYLDETGKFRFAGSAGYISTDGSGNLTVSGSITATSGSIGGFLISSDRLSSSVSTSQYVAVSGSGDYAFWAGNATASAAPFWVKNDGTSKVTGIQIGNVGGFTITSSALWGGTSPNIIGLDPTNATYSIFAGATASTGAGAKFWVTNSGSIYATAASFNGSIINSGSLTGTSNNSGSLVGGAILVPNTTTPLFKVDSSGNMTASNAYLSGSIVSNSGSIGGWQINTGSLTSGTGASAVGLTTGNYAIYAGNATASAAPFSVTNTGVLTATGANISGTLNATTGSIGGFAITGSALYGGSSGSITGLNPYNASATIFAGSTSSAGDNAKFWVSNSGSVFATAASMSGPVLSTAVMTGTISASTANFQLSNSGSITGGNITIPATGTPKFTVDSSGNMVAQSASITGFISASSGSVGGWSITTGSLTSGTTASTVGLTTGTYAIYAGNATASLAPFSVTNTGVLNASNANISGSISATSGSIGGFQINNSNLSATGIVLSSSSGLNLGSGQFTVSQAGAMVAQTASITGQISASSGNIAGWTLTGQEIGTGTGANRVALNSTGSPKMYIGYGNYGTGDTGFYVDSAGYFSLGNQLTFAPGKGTASIVTTQTTFTNNSAVVTTTYNNTSSVVIPGTLVTSSALPTGVRVASVTFNNPMTASLNYTYTGTTQTINTTFQSDNLSLLTVNGTIRGAVDSITPISSPTLFATVTSASVSAASTVLLTASGGHFFSPSTVVIFSGLTSTNGLNLLNYAASAGNAYSIISIPNSTQFIINSGSLAITAGNIPSASSGRASIQQLTMGLHPAMNAGTSWANNTGTGVRLDDYNWWLVNNQFRVGNASSYFKYDGTQFRVAGGGTYNLIMQVGAQDSANQFAITSGSTGTHSSSTTPFYVDGSGKMSLGTGLVWTGSTLSIVGSASISGSVVANSGSVGGWNIGASALSSGSINLVSGAAPKIYIGAGTYSSSTTPFYVDNSGSLSIGNKLTWNGSRLLIGDQTGGTVGFQAPSSPLTSDIAIYAGASAFLGASAAPFRVDYGGNLFATSASITGQITASSGSVGGWAIGNNSLSSGSINIFSGSTGVPAQINIFNPTPVNGDIYSDTYSNFYGPASAAWNAGNTPFYVDGTGKFSLGNALTWDGISSLSLTGTINGLTISQPGGSAYSNIAVGASALISNFSGTLNLAIGQALRSNTVGSLNLGIGYQALDSNISGNYNIGIGVGSLQSNTSGFNNIAMGSYSLNKSISAYYNIGIGQSALAGIKTGINNTAIGFQSLSGASAINSTIAIGDSSGAGAPSNSNSNIFIGSGALSVLPISDTVGIIMSRNVAIGTSAMQYQVLYGAPQDNVVLGTNAMQGTASTSSWGSSDISNIAIGNFAMKNTTGGNYHSIAIGAQSLMNSGPGDALSVGSLYNTALGEYSMLNSYDSVQNIAIGYHSLASSSSASNNIALGSNALGTSIKSSNNIGIGYNSLAYSSSTSNQIGIGYNALFAVSASAGPNIGIGQNVLSAAYPTYTFAGGNNIAIGASVGNNAASGNYSILIGNNISPSALHIGDRNVFIGYQVGLNLPSTASINSNNVVIGYGAFGSASAGVTNSVGIGPGALQNITSGDKNIAIGASAGPVSGSLSNTIAIGDSTTTTQNGQIIIGGPSSTASATQIAGATVNLGTWVSYTPTLTGTGFALGNGTATGAYCVIGKTVHFWVNFAFGSTTTAGTGAYTFNLPSSPNAAAGRISFGAFLYNGSPLYNIVAHNSGGTTTTQLYYVDNVGANSHLANVTGAAPVALAATATISINGTYSI